jgi:hypothetical protein
LEKGATGRRDLEGGSGDTVHGTAGELCLSWKEHCTAGEVKQTFGRAERKGGRLWGPKGGG